MKKILQRTRPGRRCEANMSILLTQFVVFCACTRSPNKTPPDNNHTAETSDSGDVSTHETETSFTNDTDRSSVPPLDTTSDTSHTTLDPALEAWLVRIDMLIETLCPAIVAAECVAQTAGECVEWHHRVVRETLLDSPTQACAQGQWEQYDCLADNIDKLMCTNATEASSSDTIPCEAQELAAEQVCYR